MYKYSANIATMLPKGHTDSKNSQRVGQIYMHSFMKVCKAVTTRNFKKNN